MTPELPQFRVVHYVVNPVAGFSVPVAVVVRERGGETEAIVSNHIPGPECLGSLGAHEHIKAFAPQLSRLDSIERLPSFLGPHFVFGELKHIPKATRWRSWVTKTVFRRESSAAHSKSKRGPRLNKVGRGFFARYGVTDLVQDAFKLPRLEAALDPITHWTKIPETTMLMEPLSPKRSHPQKDMKEAVMRLSAYRAQVESAVDYMFIAFVLPGLNKQLKKELTSAVDGIATVFDLDDAQRQKELARLIKRAGDPTLIEA